MEKIIIIGCPGSGKSTFARKLRDKIGIPLYYLDLIWHKSDKSNVSSDEFDEKLLEILGKDRWIIDGNYNRTMEMKLQKCDTVFLLDFPTELCLEGVKSRIGTKREDMPWVETEFDEEFKQWILDFSKDQLPYIYEKLSQYKEDKKIIVFKSREDADKYLVSFDKHNHPPAKL